MSCTCQRPREPVTRALGVRMKGLLMYGMRKDELVLLPHDPAWTDNFRAEKNRIADVLGDPSVQIEHVGGTSIPTVHAKPILDIAILCEGNGC